MFIESTSFVASVLLGSPAVEAGTATLIFFAVATPIGWVGVILTAAAVSILINSELSARSGSWYDDIMSWINS